MAHYCPEAVRQIKRYVKEDCNSYPGYDCLGWEVWHCWKLGSHKVRCRAEQEYSHRGHWRECLFSVTAKDRPHSTWVDMHFSYTRCYGENGEPISSQ